MKTLTNDRNAGPRRVNAGRPLRHVLLLVLAAVLGLWTSNAKAAPIEVGIAVCDITPEPPIWLAGYAARKHPADKVEHPLAAQALAFRNPTGERCVFVSVDNCEVSAEYTEPVLTELETKHGLHRGEVIIVSSHTHSAPVLQGPLDTMYPLEPADRERLDQYGRLLRVRLIAVVGAALHDLKPARLEYGVGQCTFAMNRRSFATEQVVIGENPDGPVDWSVPVLRIAGTNGVVRGIVFGYACHATSIAGDDFYQVSPDYIGYARSYLESLMPGAVALFLTGMGAHANPSPRGSLLLSKQHGLELAGAVIGVLGHPMRPVEGPVKLAYAEIDLPLQPPPTREQLQQDAQANDVYIRNRANA